jgi:hypothetical protein
MGVRSKVAMLPEEVRIELERRIVARAFSGYQDLAEWLQKQGFQIAEDSVQRYGFKMKQEIDETRQAAHFAKEIAEVAPDSDKAIVEATIKVINRRVFSVLLDAEQMELKDLPRFVRMAAELSRTTITRQKRAEEVSDRLEQEKQAAAKAAKPKGLTPEAYHMIRCALLDIDPFSPEAKALPGPGAVVTTAISSADTSPPGTPADGKIAAKVASRRSTCIVPDCTYHVSPRIPAVSQNAGEERREGTGEGEGESRGEDKRETNGEREAQSGPDPLEPLTPPESKTGSEVAINDSAFSTIVVSGRTYRVSPQIAAQLRNAGVNVMSPHLPVISACPTRLPSATSGLLLTGSPGARPGASFPASSTRAGQIWKDGECISGEDLIRRATRAFDKRGSF